MRQSELGVDDVIREIIQYFKKRTFDDAPADRNLIRHRLDDMQPFLEYLVNEILGPRNASLLDPEERTCLSFAIYDVIIGHRVSKLRKIGGYYSNHPVETAGVLGRTNCDLKTVLVALYHDMPEETVSRRMKDRHAKFIADLRQKHLRPENEDHFQQMDSLDEDALGRLITGQKSRIEALQEEGKRNFQLFRLDEFRQRMAVFLDEYRAGKKARLSLEQETLLIKQTVEEQRQNFEESLAALGIGGLKCRLTARSIFKDVSHLTRPGNEDYYRTIGRLLYPFVKFRALVVKFGDKIANARDVNRQLYTPGVREIPSGIEYFGADEMPLERSVIPLLRNWKDVTAGKTWISVDGLYAQIQANYDAEQNYTRMIEREEQAPQRLKGKDRLKQFYKNFIAVNEIRLKYSVGSMPPLLRHFEADLLRETRKEASNIIKHLVSCHAIPGHNTFTLDRASSIYHDAIAYMKSGGLTKITPQIPGSALDGLFSRCFDSCIRGDNKPLHELYNNKDLMFAATLAFFAIAQLYLDDKNFILEGLDRRGLHPR